MPDTTKKSLLEVQFPIGQLSLESYLERDARTGKVLNSLGKWWGTKPIVLNRSVILGSQTTGSLLGTFIEETLRAGI
jgi:adenine-specific DNA methylase